MSYRIASPGWEAFTGDLGGVEFKDGVTVRDYPPAFIDRLSTNYHIVHAETGEYAGIVTRLAASVAIPFVAPTDLEVMTAEQINVANAAAIKRARSVVVAEVFTREQLETLAEKRGILGLREVATPFGVRDKSIEGLIVAILNAQAVASTKQTPQLAFGAQVDAKVVEGVTQVAEAMPGEPAVVIHELKTHAVVSSPVVA